MEPYQDRTDAGRRLAALLAGEPDPFVPGLPRGGVVVAAEVARHLRSPLDVLVVRKVGAPGQPEFGIGAVGPGGVRHWDPAAEAFEPAARDRLALAEEVELARREREYRGERPPPHLRGRTAILVDDGLATGVTVVAAALAARQMGPARLVLAVPVGPSSAVRRLAGYVDEVACPWVPERFFAVGQWYARFDQTTDAEVRAALASASA